MYCDASALVKLYVPEPESDRLNRMLARHRDLVASDLVVTEIVSSIARRRREGAVTAQAAADLCRRILSHLDGGVFHRVDVTRDVHREAERLLLALETIALRTADALHLALAASAGVSSILTFDRRLARAASAIGLGVRTITR